MTVGGGQAGEVTFREQAKRCGARASAASRTCSSRRPGRPPCSRTRSVCTASTTSLPTQRGSWTTGYSASFRSALRYLPDTSAAILSASSVTGS